MHPHIHITIHCLFVSAQKSPTTRFCLVPFVSIILNENFNSLKPTKTSEKSLNWAEKLRHKAMSMYFHSYLSIYKLLHRLKEGYTECLLTTFFFLRGGSFLHTHQCLREQLQCLLKSEMSTCWSLTLTSSHVWLSSEKAAACFSWTSLPQRHRGQGWCSCAAEPSCWL